MDDWERCQCCDKLYGETWRAPDVLWQKITGITNGSGLFCIECFSIMAERKGIILYWECENREFPTIKDEKQKADIGTTDKREKK